MHDENAWFCMTVQGDNEPQWLRWSRQLMALAQNGLTYSNSPYDVERYEAVRRIAAEMMADRTGTDQERIVSLFAGESGYATPKVDVRGVVFRDDAILLVKEREDGGWTLPGGWADVNESPREAVEREVVEESGYQVRATKLLALLDRAKHPHVPPFPFHIYKVFILCDLIGGEAAASKETEAVGFFRENEIPELSVARTTPGQLARLFEHRRRPDLAPDFD
ncbi:MAG: NUDIX hydrolase [Thermoguttaceae bacterium]